MNSSLPDAARPSVPTVQAGTPAVAAAIAKAKAEYQRREIAGMGCNNCCYCSLGAWELCRHYDLDLAVMHARDADTPPETGTGTEGGR